VYAAVINRPVNNIPAQAVQAGKALQQKPVYGFSKTGRQTANEKILGSVLICAPDCRQHPVIGLYVGVSVIEGGFYVKGGK